MKNRWEVNGRVLRDMRRKVGLSIEEIMKATGRERRQVLGFEIGYWAFPDAHEAQKYFNAVKAACEERMKRP